LNNFPKVIKKIYAKVPWLAPSFIYSLFFGVIWLRPTLQSLRYSLDSSYIYGVEKAAIAHLSFGNHFVATYGPLGYAAQNFLPKEVSRVMIWQVLAVFAAGFGVYVFSKLYLNNTPKYKTWLFALLFLLALSLSVDEWIYFNVFLLYVFIYIKTDRRYRQYLMLGLSVLCSMLTLAKFT